MIIFVLICSVLCYLIWKAHHDYSKRVKCKTCDHITMNGLLDEGYCINCRREYIQQLEENIFHEEGDYF